jgi:aspartate ammonia-lyase
MTVRTEHDLLGTRAIPASVYWGIHTARALDDFPFEGPRVSAPLIAAIALVKKACCAANVELGYIDHDTGAAIGRACDELSGGALRTEFPLSALQGGAGTSTNLNVDEVIANRALELTGRNRGDYAAIHPLDQVNLHQSTNDVYPTAVRIAALFAVRKLSESVAGLQGALQKKEARFADIVTIGRTELIDAVPITLGAQFASFAEAIARDRWRAFKCEERLRIVNIGGTAVGTGIAAPRRYIFLVIEKLRETTGLGLARGENLMDQTANVDALVEVAGIVGALAVNLIKIANDIRHLHSRGELLLPAVQAGSSIMPGKVNPVIMEAVMSAGLAAKSKTQLVADAASYGTFQINEFMPLIAESLLDAIGTLTTACTIFAAHTEGIEADADRCARHASRSTALVTALLPKIGYERAQLLVKEFAQASTDDFRAFLEEKLGKEPVSAMLSPRSLTALGYRGEDE